ncbi:hypothetical protein [Paraliobacillus sp. JSM ZJ581]|uniref:hypothetical protein n=1 Tax=Paraliobacillus sp. JSM ZJ581 TaxID=3342118 RepID=UPI0035A81DF3
MISTIDFKILAGEAYHVDVKKAGQPWMKDDILENRRFLHAYKVLKVEDNTDNGMQAMAVAPVKNDRVDKSEIVTAYAGINPKDFDDIKTDIQTVVSGNKDFLFERERIGFTTPFVTVPVESQITTAEKFAKGGYKKNGHAAYDIKYHVIWVTKYSYKVLSGQHIEPES